MDTQPNKKPVVSIRSMIYPMISWGISRMRKLRISGHSLEREWPGDEANTQKTLLLISLLTSSPSV